MKENNKPGKRKTLWIFTLSIVVGYILFILPNIFFGVTKINGGLVGINLLWIALFQFFTVVALVYASLKQLGKDFRYIGMKGSPLKKDIVFGVVVALFWTTIQFLYLIPMTGGAEREDIQGMISMMDGSTIGLLSFMALGVIGGGITEEVFNRGYFIMILKDVFKNPKVGLYISALLSILLFVLGHLPTNLIEWIDILIPTILYTLLFLHTRRLTAPIIAHGLYNLGAIYLTYQMYYF